PGPVIRSRVVAISWVVPVTGVPPPERVVVEVAQPEAAVAVIRVRVVIVRRLVIRVVAVGWTRGDCRLPDRIAAVTGTVAAARHRNARAAPPVAARRA